MKNQLLLGLVCLATSAFAGVDTVTIVRSCTITPRTISDVQYTVDIVRVSSEDGQSVDYKGFVYNTGNIKRNVFGTYDLESPKPNGAGIIRYLGDEFKFQINTGLTVAGDPVKNAEFTATDSSGRVVDLSSNNAAGSDAATISCP